MRNLYIFKTSALALLIPAVLLVGCGGENEQSRTESDTTETRTQKPEATASLPPNSAHVVGTVQSIQSPDTGKYRISFRIDRIEEYGSSTRPLSKNEELKLTTTSAFLKKSGRQPSAGDSLRMVISQTITMGEEKDRSAWRIVDFK